MRINHTIFPALLVLLAGSSDVGAAGRSRGRVYKTRIAPQWFADSTGFWYRNDLPNGLREFVVVDTVKGVRKAAFDHARLAKALAGAGVKDVQADRLPVERLEFDTSRNVLTFHVRGKDWRCDLKTYGLDEIAERKPPKRTGLPALGRRDAFRNGFRTGQESGVTFVNRTAGAVELFWVSGRGQRRSYGTIAAGSERDQHTFAGHIWEVVDSAGRVLVLFRAEERPARAEITGQRAPDRRDERRPRRSNRETAPATPPPGTAEVKGNNVYFRSKADGKEVQLSQDGSAQRSYGMLQWAPDGKTLVAFRTTKAERKEVHLIESSPRGGGRARLRSRHYALPGDVFGTYELNLFHGAGMKQSKPTVGLVDFGHPRLRWNADGRRFTYEKVDRGHQRFRLIQIDTHTGDVLNIIDEKTETFIWTAHAENVRVRRITWLSATDEIIYASERDGWRHLYLVDAEKGGIKNQITKGTYVVRAIDWIDEEKRQIWFRASGRNPGQDPYLLQYYRINFDGSGLVALTEGNGNHSIQYSPDRRFLVDSYSRVDMAPVHELRRVSDGKRLCVLEEADIAELKGQGWEPPEVFVAKGRDGTTDIWGIICRPRTIDPDRHYPIIEDIYAGPQSSYVPKTFSTSRRYTSLTDLGFIVVKIDGMGTANRSKAFHDVCWHDLKDAGFPDRIRWIQAAAKKYPYMDTRRVGIYGTSAGGQNAAGAVLFHPEFYSVAVASCGCHDNRMDKASWNEQWMGHPVGPHYAASSNIDNAHRLKGHLLLIVGEMDTNVPPESTMRFVGALIRADKDFDLIVVPGAGHGGGGSYGRRRLHDFFVRHLLGSD